MFGQMRLVFDEIFIDDVDERGSRDSSEPQRSGPTQVTGRDPQCFTMRINCKLQRRILSIRSHFWAACECSRVHVHDVHSHTSQCLGLCERCQGPRSPESLQGQTLVPPWEQIRFVPAKAKRVF